MEEEEITTSEEYEDRALDALDKGDIAAAGVYAQLAHTATLRESTFILAEILDPSEEEEEVDDEQDDEG